MCDVLYQCCSYRPTTTHILGGCSVALAQQHYIYIDSISLPPDLQTCLSVILISADLPDLSEGPQATVPPDLLITSYMPDIVAHNSEASTVALLELICLLDSENHLQAARSRKQSKVKYLQLLAEL